MPVGITYFVAGNQYYNSKAVAAKGRIFNKKTLCLIRQRVF